jgi:TRAP-type C4-dicarboxylate transport system substrate-binding protein
MISSRRTTSVVAGIATGLVPVVALGLLLADAGDPSAKPRQRAKVEMKLATVAPDGSTWMRVMNDLDAEIRERTEGEAGLKFYPGGIQGDESVVLRKIRAGQLHGGGLTGVGLGEIAPTLRVLEVPFLFRSLDEVRYVQKQLGPRFEQILRDAGWELLGWADVGFVYLFAKDPIHSIDDLRRVRMWLWEGDPLAEVFLKTVGVSPVPLAITDVVTSLQTGLIDAVYTSPYACIALQWFTKVSTMTDLPVTYAVGAVVVSRERFEKLSPSAQEIVNEACDRHFARLAEETARESDESVQVLEAKGIAITPLAKTDEAGFERIGREVREELASTLFSQEILDQVLQTLDEYRASPRTTAGP